MKKRLFSYVTKKLNQLQPPPSTNASNQHNQIPKPNNQKPILRLFLKGIKGQLQINSPKPYNYYINIASIVLTFCLAKYIYSYKTHEIDIKGGHNWFVPQYVYKVRQQSHIYWQIVRLAKQLPTTFTYYQWDDQSLMYEINRSGDHIPFHSHKGLENTKTFMSCLHEYNFPATAEKHAKIMMYLKNVNNIYDLKNYLRNKPINVGDWIRAGYYYVYRELGLTNRWRYDEFVSKPTVYYGWEKIKLAFLISKDRDKMHDALEKLFWKEGQTQKDFFEKLKVFFVWFY